MPPFMPMPPSGLLIRPVPTLRITKNIDEMGTSLFWPVSLDRNMTRHDPPCFPVFFRATDCSWRHGTRHGHDSSRRYSGSGSRACGPLRGPAQRDAGEPEATKVLAVSV